MSASPRNFIQLAATAPTQKPLPPLRKGVTIVAPLIPASMNHLKPVFIDALLRRTDALPVPMPKLITVVEMLVGSMRYLDHFKAIATQAVMSDGQVRHKQVFLPSGTPIDWTSSGGLSLLDQQLQDGPDSAVLLIQSCGNGIPGPTIDGLVTMQRKAHRKKAHVVMIVAGLDEGQRNMCRQLLDEYFEVSTTEPDPGWDSAIKFDCVELSSIPGSDQGRRVCNIKLMDGQYEFGYAPFISDKASVRFTALMRAHGLTVEDIGKLLGKDKSGVSRDLRNVPTVRKVQLSEDELLAWMEICGIESEDAHRKIRPVLTQIQGNGVAKPSQLVRNERNERKTLSAEAKKRR